MKKSIISVLLILCLMLAVITGCANDEPSSTPLISPSGTPMATVSAGNNGDSIQSVGVDGSMPVLETIVLK